MKRLLFLIVLFVGLIFISGCTMEGREIKVSLNNLSADKEVYHSADVMNLTAIIYSNSDLENVEVKVNGIGGRLNKEKTLNLSKGINEILFSYKLPRCNVCGGIKAGDYNLSSEILYENTTIEGFTIINIPQ